MPATKRETIDFDPALYAALQERATEEKASLSDVVNDVLRSALDEDDQDHVIFEQRRNDPTVDFETFAADLKRRGRI
jgi:metal-responsive CopG/Arc/MetJ family transcriptional regulator